MEISQKVDVVGYPVEPLRVEMRNGPVNANVEVTGLPRRLWIYWFISAILLGIAVERLAGLLAQIRDALRDLKPPAAAAPTDAPKPPK
jgi:hypothetical protein